MPIARLKRVRRETSRALAPKKSNHPQHDAASRQQLVKKKRFKRFKGLKKRFKPQNHQGRASS
jgi:hypothetical protein